MKKLLICLLFPLAAFSQPTGFNTFVSGLPAASNLTGAVIPVIQGGSSKKFDASILIGTSTPTANTNSQWDANKNFSANSFITGYTTTATAAGTTTLTVSSTHDQFFTGSTTQTVVLPVTSTLGLDQEFYIVNNSTGIVTVQSSGTNVIQAMDASSSLLVKCISLSGTGTASWSWTYFAPNPMTTQGDLIVGGASGVATRLGIGSAYNLIRVNSGSTSPQYFGLTTGSVPFWSSTGLNENNAKFFWDNTNFRQGIGTATPAYALDITATSLGASRSLTAGLGLINTTPAVLNTQQYSNSLHIKSFGWGTTAGTSQATEWDIYGTNTQSTTPIGKLVFDYQLNGGGYSNVMTLDGSLNLLTAPNITASTQIATNTFIRNSAAVVNLTANGNHSGVGFNFNYTGANTQTSGSQTPMVLNHSFNPPSGTATFTALDIINPITQSGGANGITRGINIHPTLTGLADFRFLEIGAGTTTAIPVIFTSGPLSSTIKAGGVGYNNAYYLTNNALNQFGVGGVIADFTSDVNNGTTVETDIFTYTTKASTLAATGEKLVFEGSGTFNDVTATADIRFYFGGTAAGDTGALTVSATGAFSWRFTIIRTGSSTARTRLTMSTPGASTAQYTAETDITGLTFTNTNIIKMTAQAGGAGGGSSDITGKEATIFWWAAANN